MKGLGFLVALIFSFGAIGAEGNCFPEIIAPSNDPEQFIDNHDGTVTDARTALTWTVCSIGQSFSVGTCSGVAEQFSWQQALAQAQLANAENLRGHSDWRVPSLKELGSIVERQCQSPSIDLAVFPNTPSGSYRTSTPDTRALADRLGEDRFINFDTGLEFDQNFQGVGYVRLVRESGF